MLITPTQNTLPFTLAHSAHAVEGPRTSARKDSAAESIPTYDELERRIIEVRSGWDLKERISRRRVAEQRFGHLVDTLLVDLGQ